LNIVFVFLFALWKAYLNCDHLIISVPRGISPLRGEFFPDTEILSGRNNVRFVYGKDTAYLLDKG
jgi:hypothetical protein